MAQYYPLTLKDAIAKYASGDITAKGLLHFYILIKCKPGWKLKLEQDKTCNLLGISKAAFYGAISRLRTEGAISWEAPQGILVSISSSVCERGQESTIVDCESTIVDCESTIVDCESTIVDCESTIVDSKTPEVAPNKAFSDSPYSYQIFINSLSEEERESFLKFAQEKAKAMPNPPQLVDAWIAKHHADLHKQFIGSAAGKEAKKEAIAKSKDWKNDPRFGEWIKGSFERSYEWVQENEAEREERHSFHCWAQKINAYEGVCY